MFSGHLAMRSTSGIADNALTVLRLMVPFIWIFLLFILNLVAVSHPFPAEIKAPLFLMAIYYWSIYRPTLLPLWLVFIAGCLFDLISGYPLGLNALVFVMAQWFISTQRRFLTGQSFVMIWLGFAMLALLSGIVQWAVFGLFSAVWLPPGGALLSVLLGVTIFPVVCIILHITHKVLPAPLMVFGLKSQP